MMNAEVPPSPRYTLAAEKFCQDLKLPPVYKELIVAAMLEGANIALEDLQNEVRLKSNVKKGMDNL